MNNYKTEEKSIDGLNTSISAKSYLFDMPDEKLLQAIMTKEAACQLIAEYHNVYDAVMNTSLSELETLKGMGKSKIYKIECLREIIRRFYIEGANKIAVIRCPKDVFDYMADMQCLKQEQFRTVLLNTKNKIIGQKIITQGTINSTLVSSREIFNAAIKNMAANIVLVHNHPSGDPHPSEEDKKITDMIINAGKIIDISILDHIIIGRNNYYSFKEKGLI